MELNRNPDNYFAETEQAAMNPANAVPGIAFSPDKMLQGRLFSYGDAQRYRLGVNHQLIPINTAKCPYHYYHRDGQMRVDGNYGAAASYEPNSRNEWLEQPEFAQPPLAIHGAADHWNHRIDSDYFSQPGKLFRMFEPDHRLRLYYNTARALGDASEEVKDRHIGLCTKADPEYGAGVAGAVARLGRGDEAPA
jgi:catalase